MLIIIWMSLSTRNCAEKLPVRFLFTDETQVCFVTVITVIYFNVLSTNLIS